MLLGSEPDSGGHGLRRRYRDLPNPGRRVGSCSSPWPRTPGAGAARRCRLGRRPWACRRAGRRGCSSSSASTRRPPGGGSAILARDRQRLGSPTPCRRPRGPDPRRARHRPRPGGHALDARTAARIRRPRRTVLLSSHLLAEVGAVADRMIIIGGGRIRAQGTRDELLTASGTIVEADDLAALDAALHCAGLRATRPTAISGWSRPSPRWSPAWRWPTTSCCAGSPRPTGAGLERLFFELTTAGGSRRRDHDPPRAGRSNRMSATTLAAPIRVDPAGVTRAPASAGSSPSSCARWSTPARASGCRSPWSRSPPPWSSPAASSARAAITPSPASSTSGCSRRPCCCPSPGSCSSPRSGPSAPG